MDFKEVFNHYWNFDIMEANVIMGLNFLGALLLGMLLGVERTMRGRAAGLRTYGLVAGASCAMTIISGYPEFWFGSTTPDYFYPDPGRVIQGIVTGVGFLGAGVIMKDGFSITGLSTAASIWMCSAIGILVGVGFYAAAISLTFLSIMLLSGISRMEKKLPHQTSYSVQIVFKKGQQPNEEEFIEKNKSWGFQIPNYSINVSYRNEQIIWKYTALSDSNKKAVNLTLVSNQLVEDETVFSFDISKTRM